LRRESKGAQFGVAASVVFLHGGSTSSRQWDLVVERQAAAALALDVPGRGDRPADVENTSVPPALQEVMAARAAAAVVPLDSGHPPHVTMPGVIAALCDGAAADVDRRRAHEEDR
jgi:pimeloyl-ACP methyl ester carboxylesterase